MKPAIILQKIFDLKGHKIMFDFHLAELYGVETRILNQAVKRNRERFPDDFMFKLTAREWRTMSSQIVMTSQHKRPKKSLPFAFTEHGVTMLANVLKSRKAIKMSIAVVRAFISLKQFALQQNDLAKRLDELRKELHERIGEHDSQLAAIYDAIENLLDEKAKTKTWEKRQRIGFRRKNE
jgi:phage regulator Rha-like protein